MQQEITNQLNLRSDGQSKTELYLANYENKKDSRSTRVTVASSVRLVRESIDLILSRCIGLEVTESVSLDDVGIANIPRLSPDIVLVDFSHLGVGQLLPQLRQAGGNAKFIAFGLSEVADEVFACAAAGFSGYVPRDCDGKELNQALLDVAQGRMICAPHIASAMFARLSELLKSGHLPSKSSDLTGRESEILALARSGRSNKEIARCLNISPATVKNHFHNILQKLQVTRRGQAVARTNEHIPSSL